MGYLDFPGLNVYDSMIKEYIESVLPVIDSELNVDSENPIQNKVVANMFFIGTKSEFDKQSKDGKIKDGCIVIILDDEEWLSNSDNS